MGTWTKGSLRLRACSPRVRGLWAQGDDSVIVMEMQQGFTKGQNMLVKGVVGRRNIREGECGAPLWRVI